MLEQSSSIKHTNSLAKGVSTVDESYMEDPITIKVHTLVVAGKTVSEISNQLNESENAVMHSLKDLEQFGYIRMDNGSITIIKSDFSFTDFYSGDNEKHSAALKAHRLYSSDILNAFNTNSRYFFNSGYFLTDDESARWFHKSLRRVVEEFIDRSKNGKNDMLLGFQITSTNVCSQKKGEQ